ncbi:MAG: hypothetical protein IJZ95_01370 [Oscillospiraceae bacterium]|nr:hypothetical protein [Oscillospiraceae bacterium]
MSGRKTENSAAEVKKRGTVTPPGKAAESKTTRTKAPPVNDTAPESRTRTDTVAKKKSTASKKDQTATGSEKKIAEKNKRSASTKKAAEDNTRPQKTSSRKSRAKSDPDGKGSEISSKTPQVMKLVEQKNDMVNPTIMAGKSSIPRSLRGLEPLTRIMKRDAAEMFGVGGETETYNITALVIEDNAREILRRFNACDCEICVERFSQLAAEEVPARFVKLSKKAVEYNVSEVQELKAPLKKTVTSRMIRLVMQNKKRSYHDT